MVFGACLGVMVRDGRIRALVVYILPCIYIYITENTEIQMIEISGISEGYEITSMKIGKF